MKWGDAGLHLLARPVRARVDFARPRYRPVCFGGSTVRHPVAGGPECTWFGSGIGADARAEVTDTLRQPNHRKRVLQPWL